MCISLLFSSSIHFSLAPFSHLQIMSAKKLSNNFKIYVYFVKNLTCLLTPYCGWFISSAVTVMD